jgi:hypothetical protein
MIIICSIALLKLPGIFVQLAYPVPSHSVSFNAHSSMSTSNWYC